MFAHGRFLRLFFGCISSHRILTLADAKTVEEQEKNVQELVSILENTKKEHHIFFVAETAGKLKHPNKDLEQSLAKVLLDRSYSVELRAESAWALGEMGRSSDRVYPFLLESLQTERSQIVIQHVLEAISKVYLRRTHTTEEDLALVRVLDQLKERTKHKSGVFDFIHQRVESFEVLSILLLESIEEEKHIHSQEEHYRILLNFLWFCSEHPALITHHFKENKERFSTVFTQVFRDKKEQDPSTIFLALSFLVALSQDANIEDISGDVLLTVHREQNTLPEAFLIHLATLLRNTKVRNYFRDIAFNYEQDEQLLHFLSQLYARRDIAQYLYGITGEN